MPHVRVNDVQLYVQETGEGVPLIFVHEFAGDHASWDAQVRFFSRRYRCITYNARGYPPSDVPEDPAAYSQDAAVEDLRGVLDALGIERAHVCGLSMGGYATLNFGLRYPERAHSLVVAGAGYGSLTGPREQYLRDTRATADRFRLEGQEVMADVYTRGPARVQFIDKDPLGWQQFRDQFAAQSALGHALTLEGVQLTRPTVYALAEGMARMTVPTLIVTGDEDEPCLEPALFMKRAIRSSGLLVVPKSGHTINLEEPDLFNRAVLDFVTAVDAGRWPLRNPASVTSSQIIPAQAPASEGAR